MASFTITRAYHRLPSSSTLCQNWNTIVSSSSKSTVTTTRSASAVLTKSKSPSYYTNPSQLLIRANNNINNNNPQYGSRIRIWQQRWNTSSSSSSRNFSGKTNTSKPPSSTKPTTNPLSQQQSPPILKTSLQRFLEPKIMPPRNTPKWYAEMALVCTVFAITGSSTMFLVRPAVSTGLGLRGSMKDGPWSYRICSIVIMTPMYATLLVIVGTLFGRHAYFRHFSVKMFSRFGVPPELMDKNFHAIAKNFRKW